MDRSSVGGVPRELAAVEHRFAFANPMGERAASQAKQLVGTRGSSEEESIAPVAAEEARTTFAPTSARRPGRGSRAPAGGFV